jgi:hypothetical protein
VVIAKNIYDSTLDVALRGLLLNLLSLSLALNTNTVFVYKRSCGIGSVKGVMLMMKGETYLLSMQSKGI